MCCFLPVVCISSLSHSVTLSLSLCLRRAAIKHRSRGRLSKGPGSQNHSAIRGEKPQAQLFRQNRAEDMFLSLSSSVSHFLKTGLIKWKQRPLRSKTRESHAPRERCAANHSVGTARCGKQVNQTQPLSYSERTET